MAECDVHGFVRGYVNAVLDGLSFCSYALVRQMIEGGSTEENLAAVKKELMPRPVLLELVLPGGPLG